jgi:hypothetical protein
MRASRPSLHVEDNVLFLSATDWNNSLWPNSIFNNVLHILACSKKVKQAPSKS